MAFPKLAFFISLICLPIFIKSSEASHKLVDSICEKSLNSDFCKSSLGSYPETSNADTKELETIAISLATAQAKVNKYVIEQFIANQTDDNIAEEHLRDCLDYYRAVLHKLKHAYHLFQKGHYKSVSKLMNYATEKIIKCEDRFKEWPSYPAPITNYNQKMVWLNNIALVVLDFVWLLIPRMSIVDIIPMDEYPYLYDD